LGFSKINFYLKAIGGLGNQLFQLFYGKYLVSKYGQNLIIIDHVNKFNSNFSFELEDFINFDNQFLNLRNSQRIKVQKTFHEHKITELNYMNSPFEFTEDIDFPTDNRSFLFTGYFQNYKFLDTLSSNHLDSLNLFTKQIMNNLPSYLNLKDDLCVIHIRGGDYKSIKNFGNLSKEYYLNCLASIGKKLSEAVILTNDYNYSIQLLGNEAKLIGPRELGSWETLSLMSSAKYLISANSTLSWWGGYLASKFEESKVIIPSPWFCNLDTKDAFNHPMFIKSDSIFQVESNNLTRITLAKRLGVLRRFL
jgi:hypothetical protein